MQGLVTAPADQLPREGDRGQEEARCLGGSWVPQRRDTAGEKGCSTRLWGSKQLLCPLGSGHWISQVPRGNMTEEDLEGSVPTSGLLRRTEAQTPNRPLDWLAG